MEHLTYDAAIIGAGQGGSLAKYLAMAGWKTALIERRWLGGSCLNWGCTPTKTMIASARVAHLVRHSAEYGVETTAPSINMGRVWERKDAMVKDFREDYRQIVDNVDGLDVIFGEASFEDAQTLSVQLRDGGIQKIRARTIVIATGCFFTAPDIAGLAEIDYLDAESIMELKEVPEHLIILGGGYIGLEFAQMFRRFGAKVSIIQRGSQLLPREDLDVASTIQDILEEESIDVFLHCETHEIRRHEDEIVLSFNQQGRKRQVRGSHLLIATGQSPNTRDLKVERAGVELDENSYVRTNAWLETNVPGIYALGDVKGGPQFTHIAFDDTRILRSNLLHGTRREITGRQVPYVLFIDPQLGRVGMTEKEAREKGFSIGIAKIALDQTARGLETGETRGFIKAIIDKSNDQLLGVAVLTPAGGEVLGTLQMAMQAGLPYTAIRDTIFSHPTMVEALNLLLADVK